MPSAHPNIHSRCVPKCNNKKRGRSDTVLFFSSDNGGAVHEISDCKPPCLQCTNGMTSAGNNYPLRLVSLRNLCLSSLVQTQQ